MAKKPCKHLLTIHTPLSSSGFPKCRSLTPGSWPLGPRGLFSHTLSQFRVEVRLLCSLKMELPECFDCVELDFSIGSHQPKEGRCLWCAKKSTCKCKYVFSLLSDSCDLDSYRNYVYNLRKGTPLLDKCHNPYGFAREVWGVMLGFLNGSEGRRHKGEMMALRKGCQSGWRSGSMRGSK